MESLKRSVMLLRPFGIRSGTGKIGGTLKLQSSPDGISLTLKTDCLNEGDYYLYLFLTNGKELYAGDVTGGILNASPSGILLENISGAAVVHRNKKNYDFVLRSTGPDWPLLIERFRMKRTPRPAASAIDTFPQTEALNEVYHVPEPDSNVHVSQDSETEKEIPAGNINNMINEVYTQQDAGERYSGYEDREAEERLPGFEEQETEERLPGFEEQKTEERSPGFEEAGCDACPHALRETKVNPFPAVFPNSEWVKISYPGPAGWWHYISGKIYKGGIVAAKALGVPGEYGMAPPIWLEGFGTYLRCVTGDARGYWLMFQDAETGEVLDMGLSPHGA
jgi:hypothetical protein